MVFTLFEISSTWKSNFKMHEKLFIWVYEVSFVILWWKWLNVYEDWKMATILLLAAIFLLATSTTTWSTWCFAWAIAVGVTFSTLATLLVFAGAIYLNRNFEISQKSDDHFLSRSTLKCIKESTLNKFNQILDQLTLAISSTRHFYNF